MVCVPLGSHLPAPCPGEAVPVPTASLRGPIQSKLVSIESAGVPHADRALWRGRKAVWVWGPSVMGCEIVIIIIIFHVLAGDRHCPNSFWGQTLRSVSFCGTKSCRLSDLPKVAGLAHGPGLGSVYSIRPCLPGPAQGCSKPRLVNNLLSALEYLRPPHFFQCLFSMAQQDNMTLSLTHSGRNANHAPRGPVLLKACHASTPSCPLWLYKQAGQGF